MNSVNTVVFDIDDTMCCYSTDFVSMARNHPECIVKDLAYGGREHYMFNPHFEVLIRYLLGQGCQIAFFSTTEKYRNEPLMEAYLTDEKVLGRQLYDELKSQGQFRVFSRHHLSYEDKKGLKQILLPGQSINDIILVDDNHNNPIEECEEGAYIPYYFWDYREDARWPLNYVYCVLALFVNYFEKAKHAGVTLREYAASVEYVDHQCSPLHYHTKLHAKMPKYVMQLIVQGLREVRKSKPEAKYWPVNPKSEFECDLVDPDEAETALPAATVNDSSACDQDMPVAACIATDSDATSSSAA